MTPEHWQQVKELFRSALEHRIEDRPALLDRVCAGDVGLRHEVESLLASFEESDHFIETPVAEAAADLFSGDRSESLVGKRLGHYEVVALLGEGGMGEVYLAQDTRLNRRVALKVLGAQSVSNQEANQRLWREARAAATLEHPHICAIHEIAETDGCCFIVMQYVEGETLADKLKREKLNLREVLNIAVQVASALAEAHQAGLIHRDIKPANIIVNDKGQAKVLDFGLAKFAAENLEAKSKTATGKPLSKSGAIMGTVPFMSPEQVRGKRLDARTDIFSFGAMLYEMSCGRQPFSRETDAETVSAILRDEPSWPEISVQMRAIVQKALMKNTDDRYQTAQDLLGDLRSLQRRVERETEYFAASQKFGISSLPSLHSTNDNLSPQNETLPSNGLPPYGRTESVSDYFPKRTAVIKSLLGWAVILGVTLAVVAGLYTFFFRASRTLLSNNARANNSAAYDDYMRGKVMVSSENREDNETAIRLLEQAVKTDPNFAVAHAALATAYSKKAFYFAPEGEKKQLTVNAEVAVEKALALDPDLAEGHYARGLILWTHAKRFPHEQAIQSYKRAIALNPKLDDAHHQLGLVYVHIGLLDKGQAEVEKAMEINPSNTLARFRLGVINVYRGRYEEALAVFKGIPREANPSLFDRNLATALFQLGRIDEASAVVEDYLKTYADDEGGNVTSVKAMLLAKAGKEREAEETIQRAIAIGQSFGHFHHTAYNIASAYALLNKSDEALRWLQVAADDGFPCYPLFERDSFLNPIRKDPSFIQFMAEMKELWEGYQREFANGTSAH